MIANILIGMAILRELKRRKVLHTLSLYVVGCWVALQVVEVLSDAGLPPGTMRQVLVAMSIGFPVVLIISWFYDISSDGIRKTAPLASASGLPNLNLGDFALMAGLVAVIALNIYVLSFPPPVTGDSAATLEQRTLVVVPFDDVGLQDDEGAIGAGVAGELREELKRVPGLKVLGPESSRIIQLAGDNRDEVATELGVTTILAGDVSLNDGKLEIRTRLVTLPAGNIIWQAEQEGDVSDGVELQRSIVQAVVDAILPAASAHATHASRIAADECRDAYELYLRGKQLRATRNWARGIELFEEAVRVDPDCAVAWEALATNSILTWSKADFAKAGAAARRALELNESLPLAWSVLAEIAEEEGRWNEAEELYLRALYVDPTNGLANTYYAEALLARGRTRDALHYALEGYRYEPASQAAVWKVAMVARYLGDGETLIRYAKIYRGLRAGRKYDGWDELAEGYRLLGDADTALSYWGEHQEDFFDWYPQCVRASLDPEQSEGLAAKVRETLRTHSKKASAEYDSMFRGWQIIRCATWINEPDIAIELIQNVEDIPNEARFFLFFQADSGVLRQTEHFRNLVVDSGLLDYWRKWGWSDYCRPDGDSFVCD
jgi:TolB-like protein